MSKQFMGEFYVIRKWDKTWTVKGGSKQANNNISQAAKFNAEKQAEIKVWTALHWKTPNLHLDGYGW